MATYRQIHISFWQDGFVLGLTPEEKYFYLYLMSNSKTTQCGIYELPKRVIEMETGYNRETVDKLIARFMQYRKIDYYEPTQEIIIYNWIKHNSIKSPKVKACIEKEIKSVKYPAFIQLFKHLCIRYGYSIDSLSIDLGEEEEKEEEQEKEEEAPAARIFDYDDQITAWFNQYRISGGTVGLGDILCYVGKVDIGVIERAIKKSDGKHSNYCCKVLNEWLAEGKTKLEHFQTVIPFKNEKQSDAAKIALDMEIARSRWIAEGKDPDEFVYNPTA